MPTNTFTVHTQCHPEIQRKSAVGIPNFHKRANFELQPLQLASPTFYLTFPSPPHLSCRDQLLALGMATPPPTPPRPTLLLPVEEGVTV